MAKWIDSIKRGLGFAKAGPVQRRDFAAASLNRLTQGWTTSNTSANADAYRSLDALRARSRDLCQNNDYAKRFLGMVAANVVGGTGVRLQSRIYDAPGRPDTGANDAVEAAYAKWGKLGSCEVTGRMSWRDVQILAAQTVARDGECLMRKIRGKSAGNPFGFALQVLDVDRIDTRLMRPAENGVNEIKMGIEINSFGRAVAYWLRPYHPGDQFFTQGVVLTAHLRIPADEIIHLHRPDRPEAVRSVPWLHAAMVRLNNLGGYEEAAVIAARIGASKMGFFSTPDGSPANADGEDDQGVPFMSAEPGEFGVLPDGMTFESFNPDYPHAMYEQFVKACLRGVASGIGVSYHGLANDLEGVNFSSIRAGTLEERDQWISIQEWFIDSFCEPVFNEWISNALAFGQITLANGSPLPLEKREKFASHTWQGRRWQWVDPLRDMEASIAAIQNGLKAPQDVAAELGVDYEDVLVKIKQAQDLADKIGVKLGKPDPAALADKITPTQEPDPAVKALLMALAARSAEPAVLVPTPTPAAPVSVILNSDEMTRSAKAVADAVIEHSQRLHDQIREDVQNMPIVIPAPIVHVAAPNVTIENNIEPTPVTMEATIQPAEVNLTLPTRRTDTTIERNQSGDIVRTTQIETDV